MIGIIKDFINDLLALFFSGGILALGASEIYLQMQKETLFKLKQGGPSLSKFTEALTCQKYDEKMNLVRITTGHCGRTKNKR